MLSCTKINYVAHLLLLLVLNEHFPSFLTDSLPAVVHRKEVKIRIILYTLLACLLALSLGRICRICGIASVPIMLLCCGNPGSIAPLCHQAPSTIVSMIKYTILKTFQMPSLLMASMPYHEQYAYCVTSVKTLIENLKSQAQKWWVGSTLTISLKGLA